MDERHEEVLSEGEAYALQKFVMSLDYRLGIPHRGTGRGRPGGKQLSREQNLTLEEWINGGFWAVAVKSSNVTAIRYDQTTLCLFVAFTTRSMGNARLYKYPAIDWQVAEAMFLAPSLGTFVWERLRRANVGYEKLTLS